MSRLGPTTALLLAGFLATGCTYDLSVAGKACDDENPCPSGYTCTTGADGRVCTRGAGDGGFDDGDGSDGGDDATCAEGQTRCSPDLTAIQTCTAGVWDDQACGQGEYCLDTDQAAPACELPCESSADCPGNTWCNPETTHCEPRGDCSQPGVDRCNPSLDQVIRCDSDSGWDVTVAECGGEQYCDPFDPVCKDYCSDDSGCEPPETTCEPSSRKCMPVGLCTENATCPGGTSCIGGACVPAPATEATAAGGAPDLACFVGQPTAPPASPATCQLSGHLVDFFSYQERPEAVGLVVRAHLLSDVLAGRLDTPLVSTAAVADDAAAGYTLIDVPTNTQLVLEVQGRHEPENEGFSTLLTFGLYIRADDCVAGVRDHSALTLYEKNYPSYANPLGILDDPQRGLLFGRLRDCNGLSIRFGVGGVSMQADLVYYLDERNVPDETATETNASGFFVAANALPIRGVASALVLAQGVPVSLRPRPVRVFPGTASLVVFRRPLDPDAP